MLLSLCAFYFMGQLITRIRLTQRWLFILFALCNGGLVLLLQHVSSGYTTLTIVTLISAAIVPEVALVCRGRAWPYFNIYWMSALQLQCAYIFSCAIVNLSMSALWAAGTSLHRYGIFSLTMFFTAGFFIITANSRATPLAVLSDLIHNRSRSLLLLIYMAASTVVLSFSSLLVSGLIYSDNIPHYIEVSMYTDMLLKNTLILGCSFLIVWVQIRQEQSHQRSEELHQDLQTERTFRANLNSSALLSYCANITRDHFVDGFGNLSFDGEAGYRETIMTFLVDSVHPDDLHVLSDVTTPEYYSRHLLNDPNYTLRMRMFPKALLSLPDFHPSVELFDRLNSDREWLWMEFHITVVQDASSGDILVYVSLNSVDAEVSEREALIQAASTDPLTGLLNRSGMEEVLRHHLSEEGSTGTLFIIDMDYFKQVNDQLGHPTGDRALQNMADTLRAVFRGKDIIGRLGGDEFCVYAPGLASEELAAQRAQQLGQRGARVYSSPDRTKEVRVSLSIGVAIYLPQCGDTYNSLYHRADEALYQAKEAGRNTYRIASSLVPSSNG